MCKNHDFCISAKTDAIQNNIDTKSRNKDSKTDIGPKAGEDTFINTVDFFGGFEKFCYIRNPFTGNRLTCGRRNDAATLLPSPVETFFCNFLI